MFATTFFSKKDLVLLFILGGKLMEMGGLTSSSNTFNGEPIVTITNSSPLLWTMTMGYEESF